MLLKNLQGHKYSSMSVHMMQILHTKDVLSHEKREISVVIL